MTHIIQCHCQCQCHKHVMCTSLHYTRRQAAALHGIGLAAPTQGNKQPVHKVHRDLAGEWGERLAPSEGLERERKKWARKN
jgi:hypothetical protein